MSVRFILRLSVMLVIAFLGWELGHMTSALAPEAVPPIAKGYYRVVAMLFGALIGFVFAPYFIISPYRAFRRKLRQMSARALMMGVVGLFIGLVIAALLALPLSMLPGMWGHLLPFVAAVLFGALGATTMVLRDRDVLSMLGLFIARDTVQRRQSVVLLDTSVIIDGRIADICQTGFLSDTMIVPRFVLNELQHIADSPDVLRRNRGRRGLDILNRLQKNAHTPLEISELDVPEVREVDSKLIKLARELDCPIVTNDYNLNRVAEIQGIRVLNVNELANAVKAVVLPGETLTVEVIQEGKEAGQGVGYLDDGTMVVIEDGKRFIGEQIEVVVTRVLQTVAGRMIFGQLPEGRR